MNFSNSVNQLALNLSYVCLMWVRHKCDLKKPDLMFLSHFQLEISFIKFYKSLV